MRSKHPLEQISREEVYTARNAILKLHKTAIYFRSISAVEPPKAQLVPYLAAEHAGTLSHGSARPPRQARVQYDVVHRDGGHEYMASVIDIVSGKEVHRDQLDPFDLGSQPPFTQEEFQCFTRLCKESDVFKEAVNALKLDDKFDVTIDAWPYGGLDADEFPIRYIQGLCFAKLKRSHPGSNYYAFPLPIIPVMDFESKKLVRIDRLATGGVEDGFQYGTGPENVIDHCRPAEYFPELLDIPLRPDLKPLNITQPDGTSFCTHDNSRIEWQKWRFQISFNPRECAVLHDIRYNGRTVLYRLSLSEMTVPYGDPRPPFHRKQAFDLGDAGAGQTANNLTLGCDCLGAIQYLDAVLVTSEGIPTVAKNVVCIHEHDNGVGWKHTTSDGSRAVVVRARELVVQFMLTLANYDYIFAFKFDQAGGITVEIRATGILSVVNIDPGKVSPYGNVVSPGALAQNHQHIFAIRIDPAVDGPNNTIIKEESLPVPMNRHTNPHGNGYKVVQETIKASTWVDASPSTNLTIKMVNTSKMNPVSQRPVGYQFTPTPTQLLLADPESIVAKRAAFARHHVWVTKYKDGELFAAGALTNQSRREVGGVADAIARNDNVENSDVVVWAVVGFTHNPRVEDWPVMPVEKHELRLKPADFFDGNPALDVPSIVNQTSTEVGKFGVMSTCSSPSSTE